MFVDFFFFQAEDGIRDYKVTGVQTCALPISPYAGQLGLSGAEGDDLAHELAVRVLVAPARLAIALEDRLIAEHLEDPVEELARLEIEERVGLALLDREHAHETPAHAGMLQHPSISFRGIEVARLEEPSSQLVEGRTPREDGEPLLGRATATRDEGAGEGDLGRGQALPLE